MAKVSREDQHLTRILLHDLKINLASLVLKHVLQVELLADLSITFSEAARLICISDLDCVFKAELLSVCVFHVIFHLELAQIRPDNGIKRLHVCALE